MEYYKIYYTYTDYSDTIHGKRVNSYEVYEAENAQEAVDQCREDFYICNELDITSVSKRSPFGYYTPVFDSAWK